MGVFGMTFMPVTTGGAQLKVYLAELGVNPYSIPFKALKEVARNSYEIAKVTKSQDTPFLEQYVRFLRVDSYAIADYCTKPLQECNPDNDHIHKILCKYGFPPILTPQN